jgi:hypothetical protein
MAMHPEAIRSMTTRTHTAAALLAAILAVVSGGCEVMTGLQDGLYDGITGAVAEVIQAPVTFILDQLFPGAAPSGST